MRVAPWGAVLAAFIVGCGGSSPAPGEGRIGVAVDATALVDAAQVTRVSVEVTAANPAADPSVVSQDLAFDAAAKTYEGTVVVAPGARVVTVDVWAGATRVGTGSAPVTVVKDQLAHVQITVVDTTGGPPVPDHAPVILTFTVASTAASVGDSVAVAATGWDQDGDPLSWAWTASPAGCATFASPGSASTTLSAVAAGACTATVTLTANGKSDARQQVLAISPATGSVDVQGTYVPQPVIASVTLSQAGTTIFSVARDGTDATCHTPLAAGTAYGVQAPFTASAGTAMTLTSSCGGAIVLTSASTAQWTPAVAGACVLTPAIADHGLTDAFPIVVLVQ